MMNRSPRQALLLAIVASFLVYLLPVFTPHGFRVVGEVAVRDLGRLVSGGRPLWATANAGFALLLQLSALALFYWVLVAGRWRWLTAAAAAPIVVWAANVAYLVAIPALFLIEDKSAVERGDWPVACEIAGARLVKVRAGVQLELAQAREAWIAREPGGRYEVLSMPGCRAVSSVLDRSIANAVDRVSPGGAALYRSHDTATGTPHYWFSAGDGSPPQSLAPPSDKPWGPVLSRHADAIAWVESERTQSRGFINRVVMRDLDGGEERHVSLDGGTWSHPNLLSIDTRSGEIVLATGFDTIVAVDFAGAVKWGPVVVAEFGNIQESFRRQADGWVVWDGYRENGHYRVHWSLPLGQGRHEIPNGRGINDVVLDPWGRYIAISVTTTLDIGNIRDAIYVLRVHDGTEIYRRFLDRHTPTSIAFLGSHYLAVTRYDAIADGVNRRVQVLRVPGAVASARIDAWVNAYRARVAPLMPLFAKFDGEGLGEDDCGPFVAALANAVPPAPDEITADLARALSNALTEARTQCERWDPSPFVGAVLDVEHLIGSMEDQLVYEYGIAVFPQTSLLNGDTRGATIGPREMPDGSVRAKRTRVQ